jgi:cytosine/adenosine deaminase-related metal-dependent hydrolase
MAHSPFFDSLRARIDELGGGFNAHLHLDRAGTWQATQPLHTADSSERNASAASLQTKHSLIGAIHQGGEYAPGRIVERVRPFVEGLIAARTRRADTVVDCSLETVGVEALEVMIALRDEYRAVIDIRLGAYSPLGFSRVNPASWEFMREAAERADFIGGLPERDDQARYPSHIGFEESCRRLLSLGLELGRPVHLHVDQTNLAAERGAERVLDVLDDLGGGRALLPEQQAHAVEPSEPWLWLIHLISPSAYDEGRFADLLARLHHHGVGVICCPSAALSMRQHRDVQSPTHNSVARVLELLDAGIDVRVGSDNLNDVFSPASTTDLVDELFVLCNAVRFYDIEVLAKIGAGHRLEPDDLSRVRGYLSS